MSRKRGKQKGDGGREEGIPGKKREGRERGGESEWEARGCLLYTSDAADE